MENKNVVNWLNSLNIWRSPILQIVTRGTDTYSSAFLNNINRDCSGKSRDEEFSPLREGVWGDDDDVDVYSIILQDDYTLKNNTAPQILLHDRFGDCWFLVKYDWKSKKFVLLHSC